MRRELAALVAEAAQIHDAAYARRARGAPEVLRRQSILLLEARAPGARHRVDQVVRGVHALERGGQRLLAQHVALDDLRARTDPPREELGPARETAHAQPALLEPRQEPPADVAGGAGQEDASIGVVHVHACAGASGSFPHC